MVTKFIGSKIKEQLGQVIEFRRAEAGSGIPAGHGLETLIAAGKLRCGAADVPHHHVGEGLRVFLRNSVQGGVEEAHGGLPAQKPAPGPDHKPSSA